jgi:hypothetical protein
MMAFPTASHVQIKDVPLGGCLSFQIHSKTRLGFLVGGAQNLRFILDPEAETQSGEKYPAIYGIHNFPDEYCLHYTKAIIVPDLRPGVAKMGHHASGHISKAIYLVGDSLVIQAAQSQYINKFNLLDGSQFRGELGRAFYTPNWSVLTPDLDGKHQALASFSAEN